jgi:hypothetical protein
LSFPVNTFQPIAAPKAADVCSGIRIARLFFSNSNEVQHRFPLLLMPPEVLLANRIPHQLGYRCAAVLRTDVQRRPQTFIEV